MRRAECLKCNEEKNRSNTSSDKDIYRKYLGGLIVGPRNFMRSRRMIIFGNESNAETLVKLTTTSHLRRRLNFILHRSPRASPCTPINSRGPDNHSSTASSGHFLRLMKREKYRSRLQRSNAVVNRQRNVAFGRNMSFDECNTPKHSSC